MRRRSHGQSAAGVRAICAARAPSSATSVPTECCARGACARDDDHSPRPRRQWTRLRAHMDTEIGINTSNATAFNAVHHHADDRFPRLQRPLAEYRAAVSYVMGRGFASSEPAFFFSPVGAYASSWHSFSSSYVLRGKVRPGEEYHCAAAMTTTQSKQERHEHATVALARSVARGNMDCQRERERDGRWCGKFCTWR